MLGRIAAEIGLAIPVAPPEILPRGFAWGPGCGPLPLETALAVGASPLGLADPAPAPHALILAYRSAALGGDGAPANALAAALRRRGVATLTLAVASLKDPEAVDAVRAAIRARKPDLIVAATAFSAREDAGFVLDMADCPVLQAFTVAAAGGLGGLGAGHERRRPRHAGGAARIRRAALGLPDLVQAGGGGRRRLRRAPRGALRPGNRRTRRPRRSVAPPGRDAPGKSTGSPWCCPTTRPAPAARASRWASTRPRAPARSCRTWRRPATWADRCRRPPVLMHALTDGVPDFAAPLADYADWLGTLPDGSREALSERWGARSRLGLPGRRVPVPVGRSGYDTHPPPSAGEGGPPRQRGRERERRFRTRPPLSPCAQGTLPRKGGRRRAAGRIALFLQPDRGRSDDRRPATTIRTSRRRTPTSPSISACAKASTRWCIWGRRHHRMAAGQGRGALARMLAGPRRRRPAGGLSVHRRRSRRGGPAEAPARGRRLGHLTPAVEAGGLDPEAARLRELVEEYCSASVLDPRRRR